MRLPTFYEQNLIPNWGNFATEILNGRCEVYVNYIKRNKLKTITY